MSHNLKSVAKNYENELRKAENFTEAQMVKEMLKA
jgi:hypothetical protein